MSPLFSFLFFIMAFFVEDLVTSSFNVDPGSIAISSNSFFVFPFSWENVA